MIKIKYIVKIYNHEPIIRNYPLLSEELGEAILDNYE
jgi:hypothetical protein